jgi:hypothetical protein
MLAWALWGLREKQLIRLKAGATNHLYIVRLPRPYVWVKTADAILKSIARYLERLPGNSATN